MASRTGLEAVYQRQQDGTGSNVFLQAIALDMNTLRKYKWYILGGVGVLAVAVLAVSLRAATRPHEAPPPIKETTSRPSKVVSTTSVSPRVVTTTTPTPAPVPVPQIGDEECLGHDGCPDQYPLPYKSGEWPSEYTWTGELPEGFIWGLGTASYQIEGAYNEDGRGASIWDTFSGANTLGMKGADCSYCCKKAPCPVNPAMGIKGATGNVACDGYHMVDTDVTLMKSMGLKHYRFSIAWPRIYPTGHAADGINSKGIDFYNRLIDKLLDAGITPYVTLYHWDLPQGLLSPPEKRAWWARDDATGEPIPEIQEEFLSFVDTCFAAFGDRVKMWFTFNEPWTLTFLASGMGKAPCHPDLSEQPKDPYIAAHNLLNAHAAAVDLYRRKYQKKQGGKIGITLNSDWREPKTTDPQDVAAALRGMAFNLGWFGDPIFGGKGDYPPSMRRFYRDRLPKFTKEQQKLINGSADFFALNHYGSGWSSYSDKPGPDSAFAQISNEGLVHGQSVWLYGAGWGLRKLLQWVHHRYGHPIIYLTEGGWSIKAEDVGSGIVDKERALYYYNYTSEMARAINEDGIDVRGYFAWSLMDNYEWERGYVERFGMVYNDFRPGWDEHGPLARSMQPTPGLQVRTRKFSSCWLEKVTTENALTHPDDFIGCVDPAIFRGNWTDARHPHCPRIMTVDLSGLSGHVVGANNDSPAGCNGKTDKIWGPLRAAFSGGTIVVDFSGLGGSDRLQGFWNNKTKTIDWGDGSFWMPVRQLVMV